MQTYNLKAGYTLTVETDALTDADYERINDNDNSGGGPVNIGIENSVIIGPFTEDRIYAVINKGSGVTATIAFDDLASLAESNDAKQAELSGATLTGATVAGNDKVLIQDTSNSNNLKTVTAQSIADLVVDSVEAATLQANIDGKQDLVTGVSSTEIGYLDGVTSGLQTQLDGKADTGDDVVASLANDADGTAIATAVNGIITALIASGILAAS